MVCFWHTEFVQTILRASEAYDSGSKDLIISEYASRFAWYHQVEAFIKEQELYRTVYGMP